MWGDVSILLANVVALTSLFTYEFNLLESTEAVTDHKIAVSLGFFIDQTPDNNTTLCLDVMALIKNFRWRSAPS